MCKQEGGKKEKQNRVIACYEETNTNKTKLVLTKEKDDIPR